MEVDRYTKFVLTIIALARLEQYFADIEFFANAAPVTVSAQTPTVAGSAEIGINGVAEVLKSPVLGRAGSSPALGISSYNWFTAE